MGSFLYCIGGCRRMVTIDDFPAHHVGICEICTHRQLRSPSLESYESDCVSITSTYRERTRVRDRSPSPLPPRPRPRPRQDRHATLTSSVTAYSDIGEYPSGRSTYGKLPRKKSTKRQSLPNRFSVNSARQSESVHDQLDEVEGLWNFVTTAEISELQRRRAHRAPDTQQTDQIITSDGNGSVDDGLEDLQSLPSYMTPTVRQCIEHICEAWNTQQLTDVFPRKIWPKEKTLWSLSVLKVFLTMARRFPSSACRHAITAKFVELNTARRNKLNAKSQWAIGDADATLAWAEKEYRSLVPHPRTVDDGDTDSIRPSQRQRIPSQKAAALLENSSKGNMLKVVPKARDRTAGKLPTKPPGKTPSKTLSRPSGRAHDRTPGKLIRTLQQSQGRSRAVGMAVSKNQLSQKAITYITSGTDSDSDSHPMSSGSETSHDGGSGD
jgi:hypothetical protein